MRTCVLFGWNTLSNSNIFFVSVRLPASLTMRHPGLGSVEGKQLRANRERLPIVVIVTAFLSPGAVPTTCKGSHVTPPADEAASVPDRETSLVRSSKWMSLRTG